MEVVSIEIYQQYLLKTLGEGFRYQHSLIVAEYCFQLGQFYESLLDPMDVKVVGLLHDIAKPQTIKQAQLYLEKYHLSIDKSIFEFPAIVHGYLGAIILQQEMNITNPIILEAVTYHSTGKQNFSMMGLILYICDFLASYQQMFPENEKFVDHLFQKATKDIYKAAKDVCEIKINDLEIKKLPIHPDSQKMLIWLKDLLK